MMVEAGLICAQALLASLKLTLRSLDEDVQTQLQINTQVDVFSQRI